MKIVEYKVATGLDSEEIADEVRGLIGEGWQPLGGVCHTQVRLQQQKDADWYCQAMVKYAPETPAVTAKYGPPIPIGPRPLPPHMLSKRL